MSFPTTGQTGYGSAVKGYIDGLIGGYDARVSGVVADGTTNDRAAVVAAIAAANAAGTALALPAGKIRNTGAQIAVPSGTVIRGRGLGITTWDGPGFEVSDKNLIEGITFDGTHATTTDYGVSTRTSTAATDCVVRHNAFTNWPGPAVLLAASADALGATRVKVHDNQFTANGYAVLGERMYECEVSSNSSVNAASTGYHFQAYSAVGCRWLGNKTENGITGIVLLSNRAIGGGNGHTGNVISGNRVLSPSEEGISLDCGGNGATTVNICDWGTVAAKSYSGTQIQIQLDSAFAGLPAGKYTTYKMVLTTGGAAGTVLLVDGDNGSNTLYSNQVPSGIASLVAVGDEIVIGAPFSNNVVTGNTVRDAGTTGIMSWGFGAGNVISDNAVHSSVSSREAIGIHGLDGLVTSSAAFTTRFGRGPAVGYRVIGNTVNGSPVTFGVTTFNAAPGFAVSRSNVQQNNTLSNAVVSGAPSAFVGARVTRTAGYTNVNGAPTAFPFDTELFDSDGFHDNVTNNSRLTVPLGLAGTYVASAGFGLSTSVADGTRVFLELAVNGTAVPGTRTDVTEGGASFAARSITSGPMVLAAGDYVEARYFVGAASSADTTLCSFSMMKVG